MAYNVTNKEVYKKNIKILKTTVSDLQTLTDSWANVVGSQISYTPASGCTYVIYNFTTQMSYLDSDNNAWFKLQYGSDISTVGDITTNNVGYINAVGGNSTYSTQFSMLLNLSYTVPVWSGEKVLVIQSRSSSTDFQSYLNGLNNSVSFTNTVDYFNPFVEIYSI